MNNKYKYNKNMDNNDDNDINNPFRRIGLCIYSDLISDERQLSQINNETKYIFARDSDTWINQKYIVVIETKQWNKPEIVLLMVMIYYILIENRYHYFDSENNPIFQSLERKGIYFSEDEKNELFSYQNSECWYNVFVTYNEYIIRDSLLYNDSYMSNIEYIYYIFDYVVFNDYPQEIENKYQKMLNYPIYNLYSNIMNLDDIESLMKNMNI